MIQHPSFRVEPWALHETALHLDVLAQTESLLALSNGHIGVRGNLDEGEPHGLPGSYLNGFHELRPFPSAETQYGAPVSSQSLIDVTNAKIIRLLVDDEPFDVRYGQLRAHDRVLDFRAGTLKRTADWCSPARRTIRVTSVRVVSFTQRAILGIAYEVEPLDGRANVAVQSELVANEQLPSAAGDPRTHSRRPGLTAALRGARGAGYEGGAHPQDPPKRAAYRRGDGSPHQRHARAANRGRGRARPGPGRGDRRPRAGPGAPARQARRLRLVPRAEPAGHARSGCGRPCRRSRGRLGCAPRGAAGVPRRLLGNRRRRARRRHRASASGPVRPVPDPLGRCQGGGRAIPAKGLTGTGYDGHTFWDSEIYILPLLAHTRPSAAADALRWRHSTLATAKERARDLGLAGAAFPWRTINGEESSGYWPASTAAFHINADVAFSVSLYVNATGDDAFERDTGVEILVETARLWRSLGHHDLDGNFRIDGVTGPDEYGAIADNNVYTNLMAQRNLVAAVTACRRHQDKARELRVTPEEMETWRAAAERVVIPYDDKLGVHQQSEGFTRHEQWKFASTAEGQYPLLLHFPYFDLYRKQVVKQPDLVLAMQLCSGSFTPEQRARNFDFYERITVRDSSLSAGTEAVAAADAGQLRLALDDVAEAALMDLDDFEHNTRDGLHLGSLAGTWIGLVAGLGGLRDHGEILEFAPRLSDGLTRLAFSLLRRGLRLRVNVTASEAEYSLGHGTGTLEILHHGERLELTAGHPPTIRPIPPTPERRPPTQPPGRGPRRRSVQSRRRSS